MERVRDPRRRPLLVVVTDGRATGGPGRQPAGRRPRRGRAAGRGRNGERRRRLRVRAGPARAWPAPLGAAPRRADRCDWRSWPPTRSPPPCRVGAEGGLTCRRDRSRSSPTDGLTTRQRRNRPLLVVHTGADEGQVHRRLRHGAARLEPGLVDRGLPVRQERQVEGRRGERADRARSAARADRRGRPGRLAQDGRAAGAGRAGRAPRPTTPPTPPRAGRRSSATSPPRRTASTCSTSSPTR